MKTNTTQQAQQPVICFVRMDEIKILIEEQFVQFFEKLNGPTSNHPVKKTDDLLLSRQEAADFLKITLPTLRAWTKSGILKSSKIESRVYYSKADLLNTVKYKA